MRRNFTTKCTRVQNTLHGTKIAFDTWKISSESNLSAQKRMKEWHNFSFILCFFCANSFFYRVFISVGVFIFSELIHMSACICCFILVNQTKCLKREKGKPKKNLRPNWEKNKRNQEIKLILTCEHSFSHCALFIRWEVKPIYCFVYVINLSWLQIPYFLLRHCCCHSPFIVFIACFFVHFVQSKWFKNKPEKTNQGNRQ